jgi:hypothetical protein
VWINHILVDISSWWHGMQPLAKGQIPYVDFSREYPVGAGLCYWGLWKLFLFKDFSEFLYTHVIFIIFLNYFVVLGVYFVLEKINSSRSLLYSLFYLLFPVAFFVGPTRFEPVVMLFVIWGYYFHLKDNDILKLV